ncbi:MAG TPA: SpoIIE family protein phosphatase [Anaerolineae bacterium]|nr:SpoIIE family protein phosphatase [Anaerolineae bacterium]
MNLIDSFAATLAEPDVHILSDVNDYVKWQTERGGSAFAPTEDDDVDLRNYLLEFRNKGANREDLKRTVNSLKRFYQWAKDENLISTSPFDDYDFDRPFLKPGQIRRRAERITGQSHEREIAYLRLLNHLSEQLNRSVDVQMLLDTTLESLQQVQGLPTAWAFLTDSSFSSLSLTDLPAHGFVLAAARGLPPGLEQEDRRYLRQPPACHCQRLLRGGRLTHAVNVVECSRLQDAARARGDNQRLLFHASMPLVSQGRLIGIINVATDEWQFLTSTDLQLLSAVGAQVTVALERARLYDTLREQYERFQRELEMARTVQASLLPRELPTIIGVRLAALWNSAREVAGDFYDILQLRDGRWAFAIGDVADKGAPAALYMAMMLSLVRASAARHAQPATVLKQVNAALLTQTSADLFGSVFYAVLDPATYTLTYANAGHPPPLLRRVSGQTEQLPPTGPVLGVFEDLALDDASISMQPGDALVTYTDGVTEGLNGAGDEYGSERLTSTIVKAPLTASELLEYLATDLADFVGMAPQQDDITLLVLTRD